MSISRLIISFDEAMMTGVACNLNSRGFHVLCKATEEVVGHVKPYSITGSLPLIRELQVQILSLQKLTKLIPSHCWYWTTYCYCARMKVLMFKLLDMVRTLYTSVLFKILLIFVILNALQRYPGKGFSMFIYSYFLMNFF